jgi:Uma2 family endonuclease
MEGVALVSERAFTQRDFWRWVRGLPAGIPGKYELIAELPTGDTVEPDASYVSHERWRKGPRPQREKLLRIVPDLVVEILSPDSRTRDLGRKREIYAAAGVREYWVLDTDRRRLLVFDLASDPDAPARVLTARQRLTTSLLPALRARVGELFQAP